MLRKYLARVKRKILKKPFLKDKRLAGYWFDLLLSNQTAFLVQIGSNDGKTGDPLFPLLQKNKQWKALFVEPVPKSFQELKNNYPDFQRFQFENVAINEGTSMNFYWVDEAAKKAIPDLPYWYNQLGSFSKEHILKELNGQLAPFIRTKKLQGMRLSALFKKHQVEKVDLLHIDTEGYDWNILSQLNLKEYQPTFILFEQNHLTQKEHQAAVQFLTDSYFLFSIGIDLLAVEKTVGKHHLKEMKGFLKSLN